MKAFDKRTDKNLSKRTVNAGITTVATGLDAIAGGIPAFTATWLLCRALIGNAMDLRQQRVLEWVEMVRDNPKLFNEEVMNSPEFQDAFVVALEDYMRIRTVLKRGIARKIFMGYATAIDKEHFELERYNMTLRQISTDSLEFIGYLRTSVEPRQLDRVNQIVDSIDFAKSPVAPTIACTYITKQNPLSYIYKELNLNSSKDVALPRKPDPHHPHIQSSVGITIREDAKLTAEQCLTELVSLGILTRTQYTTSVSDNDSQTSYHDIWDYTNYGKTFAAYIGRLDKNGGD